eukprot:753883-Pleurochrysis_carterae.AAC.2
MRSTHWLPNALLLERELAKRRRATRWRTSGGIGTGVKRAFEWGAIILPGVARFLAGAARFDASALTSCVRAVAIKIALGVFLCTFAMSVRMWRRQSI